MRETIPSSTMWNVTRYTSMYYTTHVFVVFQPWEYNVMNLIHYFNVYIILYNVLHIIYYDDAPKWKAVL